MATAKMVIGMLPGVDRPALAALIPKKLRVQCCYLTSGANLNASRTISRSLRSWVMRVFAIAGHGQTVVV